MKKKILIYFIFLLTVILLIGYILIAFNNRYQYDDLGLYSFVRDNGLWNAFRIMYFSWETTYLSLVLYYLLKWIDVFPAFIYNILILLINVYCFYLFLKTLFQNYGVKFRLSFVFLFSALIIALSYFACRAMGNVIYWVTGQIVYCLFLSFLFLGLHFWIKRKILLACVCMFLFGHTRINYDAIFIGLYSSYFLSIWFFDKRKIVIDWRKQIPFLFFLAGMISYVIIPGNYHRADTFANASPIKHIDAILIVRGWISAFKHLAGTILSSWKQLIILPIGVLLGIYVSDNISIKKLITPGFLIKCSLAFIIAYIGQATVLIIAIKTPVGYGRIFFFLELLLFILMLLYGIHAGIVLNSAVNTKVHVSAMASMALAILFFVGFYYYNNYRVSTVFANAYDKRIELLESMKQSSVQKNIYLKPLPYSGLLDFSEISPEDSPPSSLDNNEDYVRYYHLPFRIFLKK